MEKKDLKKLGKSGLNANEIISSKTDPDFYSSLEVLPNPDHLLRRMGKAQETYLAIAQDAHVAGEIRSSRSGLLKFETKITAGGESAQDKIAYDLCVRVMAKRPSKNMCWSDVLWNMCAAQYFGFVVHEITWEMDGDVMLPAQILDRKNSRIEFSHDGDLLVKNKMQTVSSRIDPRRVLITRHQPSSQNPYGIALFSSCFWPYTFKHSGLRSYTKFINKYGNPWAIGKYPQGTTNKERDDLVESLQAMVEDAVAAIPDGNSVELIEAGGAGKTTPQDFFIQLCNKEMSKALTSQTMATEQGQNGSRAAAETARGREESVDSSQRMIVEETMNELFALVTSINVPDAVPPKFSFYQKSAAPLAWLDAIEKARKFMPVSKEFAQQMTGIPAPTSADDTLQQASAEFASAAKKTTEFDRQQELQVDQIYKLLSAAKNTAEFKKELKKINIDDGVAQSLELEMLEQLIAGRSDV